MIGRMTLEGNTSIGRCHFNNFDSDELAVAEKFTILEAMAMTLQHDNDSEDSYPIKDV